jgi:hypothetical protein
MTRDGRSTHAGKLIRASQWVQAREFRIRHAQTDKCQTCDEKGSIAPGVCDGEQQTARNVDVGCQTRGESRKVKPDRT